MAYKAVLAGATGLIGSELLKILLTVDAYDQILVVARKSTGIWHPKLTELIIDFDQLDDYSAEITGHALFSCLGTTRNKTPDKTIYRKIDHDYPVKLAQIAAKNGVEQYHLVSSLGANSRSSSYYIRFKGETEEDVKQSGVKSIHIYQPSFITGDRKEFRLAEKILVGLSFVLNPLLVGSLKKYRSIAAKSIAQAMFNQSIKSSEGIFVYPSDKIKELANKRVRIDKAVRDKYQISFHSEYNPRFGDVYCYATTNILSNTDIAFHIQSSQFGHIAEIRDQIKQIINIVNRFKKGLSYDEFWGSTEALSQLFIYPDTNTVEVNNTKLPLPDFLEILKEWEWFVTENQK